jgi:hypothetical protein
MSTYSPRHRAPYSELVELAGAGMTPATCHKARHAGRVIA